MSSGFFTLILATVLAYRLIFGNGEWTVSMYIVCGLLAVNLAWAAKRWSERKAARRGE
ncbi:hypothetical protein [Brevibacillus agri]|uniref:hypothetical protein n=1 Tax=Brevibacillus agri TaxID=51101 RepID=UPI002867C922|nr:hypothetical protein [Brevibacillus agri]